MNSIRLSLPLPPSVNALYRNLPHRGRVKTSAYKSWQAEAALAYKPTGGFPDAVGVQIILPHDRRSDCDNRVKPLLDFLVIHGVIRDDRYVDELRVYKRAEQEKHTCAVTVWAA